MYNRVRTRKGMLNNTYIILYVHERVFVRGRTFCAWHIFFTTLFSLCAVRIRLSVIDSKTSSRRRAENIYIIGISVAFYIRH